MSEKAFHAIVIGEESLHNLRLADLLRKLLSREQVFRYLELRHLLEHLADNDGHPIGLFIDLFSFEPERVTQTIGYIREQYPAAVICLYLSNIDLRLRWKELPDYWQERLDHYYRIFKEPPDIEIEPVVRRVLWSLQSEAVYNVYRQPLRLTEPTPGSPLSQSPHQQADKPPQNAVFISYSRQDWDAFVSPLVNRLRDKGYAVWVDQHLLVGGDDWMDSIGEALHQCAMLLLVVSPESLGSKFVKMEYRYFFNNDKPIIPLVYRPVQQIPPELSLIQYIDFSGGAGQDALKQLYEVIESKLPRR